MQNRSNLKHALPRWLTDHGIPLKMPFRCLNPAHIDAHPSMAYNPKKEYVHCFACGVTYDIFDLVGQELGTDNFALKLREVNRRYGDGISADSAEQKLKSAVKVSTMAMPGKMDPYFSMRGLSDQVVKRFCLRVEDGYAVLPFLQSGRQIAVCRRAVEKTAAVRYRNSMGAIPVWNVETLAQNRPVFITEGIFDALSLEECGYAAAALCGAANIGKLAVALDSLGSEKRPLALIAAGDSDVAGHRMNEQLKELAEKNNILYCKLEMPQGIKDVNELLQKDSARLHQLAQSAVDSLACNIEEVAENNQVEHERIPFIDSLRKYLLTDRSIVRLSSGLPILDTALGGGFRPGLCVLGGVSGVGKTTLMLQLADTWAAQGQPVLYFTAEMSPFELAAKSMARVGQSALPGVTARQILDAQVPETQLEELLLLYWDMVRGNLEFAGTGELITPTRLSEEVSKFADRCGKAPVVLVDYLQLLAPERSSATDKQKTDRAVVALKQIARRWDTLVLCASSFNREAYSQTAEVNMSAFKETGLVEYSADLLLALQAVMSEDKGVKQDSTVEGRTVALKVLKNRFGAAGTKVRLCYRPEKEVFEPIYSVEKKRGAESVTRRVMLR